MDNNKYCTKILEASNIYSMKDMSDFVRLYIEKLIYNIYMYVDKDIKLGNIEQKSSFSGKCELSQGITGVPSATSGIDSSEESLAMFAENYSHLGINEFNILAREVILDFLNLHNGLFVVLLSKNNLCELSLDVPKQNGNYALDLSEYKSITIIPVLFVYGTINFYLCEA